MDKDCDNHKYAKYSLDHTAQLLASRFPQSLVMVVKPQEMFLNIYSIFSNFVDFTNRTEPSHCHNYGGIFHLVKLYRNMIKELEKFEASETDLNSGFIKTLSAQIHPNQSNNFSGKFQTNHMDHKNCSQYTCIDSNVKISLVGFSKGCVVLNQFLYELPLVEDNRQIKIFMSKVKAMYWLDGGHAGKQNTWVTNDEVLKTLTDYDLGVSVHVTPYQVKDIKRPWIGREQILFVSKLKQLSARINVVKHHFDEPGSIENHFNVLNQF